MYYMENVKQYFSEYIKELRLQKGLSQRQLEKEIHISQATIARLEKGLNMPDVETLIAYSVFFNLSIDTLLGLNNKIEI